MYITCIDTQITTPTIPTNYIMDHSSNYIQDINMWHKYIEYKEEIMYVHTYIHVPDALRVLRVEDQNIYYIHVYMHVCNRLAKKYLQSCVHTQCDVDLRMLTTEFIYIKL